MPSAIAPMSDLCWIVGPESLSATGHPSSPSRRGRTPRRFAPLRPSGRGTPASRRSAFDCGLAEPRASACRSAHAAAPAISRSRSGLAGARRSSRAQRIAVETPATEAMPCAASSRAIVSSISSGSVEARRGAASARSRPCGDPGAMGDPGRLGVGGQLLRRVVDDQHLVDAGVGPRRLDDLGQERASRAQMSGV